MKYFQRRLAAIHYFCLAEPKNTIHTSPLVDNRYISISALSDLHQENLGEGEHLHSHYQILLI